MTPLDAWGSGFFVFVKNREKPCLRSAILRS